MAVYLDLMMILNFAVDYLLLLCAERVAGYVPAWGRIAWASVLGGIYSGVCLLPGFRFLGNIVWRIMALAVMSVIAFGINSGTVRKSVIFILMTMALGGAVSGLQAGSFDQLLGTAFSVTVLCLLGFKGKTEAARYLPVELEYNGRKMRMTALHDTGNTLRDPISGEQVFIAGADVGIGLFGLKMTDLENPLETVLHPPISGLRLIPFSSVGQPSGMLLAVRCVSARIDRWHGRPLIAFSSQKIGKDDIYQLLAGGIS